MKWKQVASDDLIVTCCDEGFNHVVGRMGRGKEHKIVTSKQKRNRLTETSRCLTLPPKRRPAEATPPNPQASQSKPPSEMS